MLPTLLVLGFVVALLFDRRAAWVIPVAAVAWAIAVGEPMGVVFGAANTAIGFACGWLARTIVAGLRGAAPKRVARPVQ